MDRVRHKRTDTFRWSGSTGVDLTGYTLRSQVRDPITRAVVAELDVDITDAEAGTFVLLGDSTSWPVKDLLWDIQVRETSSGHLASTELVTLTVYAGATE